MSEEPGSPYPYRPGPTQEQRLDALEYHQILRAGRDGWGWYAGGIVSMVALFLVVNAVVVTLGAALILVATGTPSSELGDRLAALVDTSDVTPSVLLFLNVVLILGIPSSWFCVRVFHGLKPRWLASVAPRIRWRWLAASFGVAFVSLLIAVVLGALLPASGGENLSGGANDFTSTSRDFLLVIVLLTPLQAVAEEYVFRGYLTQVFGGLVRDRWASRSLAVLAPALLFAVAHGTQSFPIFFDRFAFGIVAGVLVIVTGGLEAGIAYHVLNNLFAFGITMFFGNMTEALTPTGGSALDVLLSFVKSAIFVSLSILVARKMGVQTVTTPGVLEGPVARV